MINETSVASPCIRICRLDEAGYCEGCLRSIEEITDWWIYSEAEKREVIASCKARIRNLTQGKSEDA
ncbi:MAG: DUF1289 domain-containing protein [Fimbriimonadaceae bacterium]|nr:DUF1289 domain-containing protein [Fimbriimonadaceae bacterium]